MSVDTNVKGKNLAPYRRMRHGELRILVAPELVGLASRLRLTTHGTLRRRFVVELASDRPEANACDIPQG